MKYKSIAFLLGATTLALSACASSTQHQLQAKIGKPALSVLAKAEHVSIVNAANKRTKDSQADKRFNNGIPKDLSIEQITHLRQMLLSDKNYSFDRIKRCLFVPDASYQFSADKKVDVIVSFSCLKIKIVSGKNTSYIDYDPMADQFNAFSHDLLNQSNPKKSS